MVKFSITKNVIVKLFTVVILNAVKNLNRDPSFTLRMTINSINGLTITKKHTARQAGCRIK